MASLVEGIAAGCRDAGCALVGGETAEHPGLMTDDAFDLAGFCVGVIERDRIIDGSAVRPGDAIVGLAASGLHANGFSLVRSLIAEYDLDLAEPYQERLRRSLGDAQADVCMAAEPERALATLGEVLLTPTRVYAGVILRLRAALEAIGRDLHGIAHITGGGLPGNVPRALPTDLGVRVDPASWPLPSVMRLLGALGGMEDDELRATFNGGLGMIVVVAPDAVGSTIATLQRGRRGGVAGRRGPGRRRARRGALRRGRDPVTGIPGRIAVGVSGAGSNLRALAAAADRAELGGSIVLVFADRAVLGARLGDRAGDRHGARARRPRPRTQPAGPQRMPCLPKTLEAAGIDLVVLAGYMRLVGPRVLAAFPGRILNTHPSLLPAFPGGHAVRDALAHGVAVSGATVHLVDATLDGGPIVAQEAVPVVPGDDEATLHDRIRAVEHRLLPRVVALALAGALTVPTGNARGRDRCRSCRGGAAGPAPCPPVGQRQDRPGRSSGAGSSASASSSCRPAGPLGRSARPACR